MRRQPPNSHRDVLAQYRTEYEHGVADGSILPFVYPIATLTGAVALIFFLFVPPHTRCHNVFTRYLVFAFIACWHVYYIRQSRGINMTTSFGIGIISAWATLWSAVLLIFEDKKARAKRIDSTSKTDARTESNGPSQVQSRLIVGEHGEVFNGSTGASQSRDVRKRKGNPLSVDSSTTGIDQGGAGAPDVDYHWQAYPSTLSYGRFEWTADLWSNFRGLGWDYCISGLPSTPPTVQAQLSPSESHEPDKPITSSALRRYDTKFSLLLRNIWLVSTGYLALDALITVTHHDPYFWGYTDSPAPSHLPPSFQDYPLLLRSYRLAIGMSIIWLGLRTLFSFASLIFVPLGYFFPNALRVRGEPWLYPDHYASYLNVLDRGLAGWWGGWWHQTFRYAFISASIWVCSIFRVEQRSMVGKVLGLFVAFGLSGVLHASGSMTQAGQTRPWMGPFTFFALQPVGMIAEMGMKSMAKGVGLAQRTPRWIVWVCNLVWVHAWFLLTGSLLVDDMAKGGLWLVEPVMLSPLRGLGYGVEGDGLFCWGGSLVRWHRDPSGWIWSGFAL